MQSIANWLTRAVFVLLLAGCAGIGTAPSSEVRQALTPTGKLRVGLNLGSPAYAVKDPASNEFKGVGYDLGNKLAERMGVAFEPVFYPTIAALIASAKSGDWDVTFIGVTPDRARNLDFTAPYLALEFGYLILGTSSISALGDVDRPGVRVTVQETSTADVFFSGALKNAVLVRGSGLAGALELLKSGKADAFAGSKANLAALSAGLPGSRVVDGSPGGELQAMALPKGKTGGMAYVQKFLADAKAQGLVKQAVDRAGLRNAAVTPAE